MKIFRDLPGYSAWDRVESAFDMFFDWCTPPRHAAYVGAGLVVLFFSIHLIARVE
jgi:hypothetical protein